MSADMLSMPKQSAKGSGGKGREFGETSPVPERIVDDPTAAEHARRVLADAADADIQERRQAAEAADLRAQAARVNEEIAVERRRAEADAWARKQSENTVQPPRDRSRSGTRLSRIAATENASPVTFTGNVSSAAASGNATIDMVSPEMLRLLWTVNPFAPNNEWFLPIICVLFDSGFLYTTTASQ